MTLMPQIGSIWNGRRAVDASAIGRLEEVARVLQGGLSSCKDPGAHPGHWSLPAQSAGGNSREQVLHKGVRVLRR